MPDVKDDDILWWSGVLHTDCYIHRKNGRIVELRLLVGKCSLPMLERWKSIFDELAGKNHRIETWRHYDKRYEKYQTNYAVRDVSKKRISELMKKVPCEVFDRDPTLLVGARTLGPYLAGIIDGDGHIQIRKRYSDAGYEKLLKITDGKSDRLIVLQKLLSDEGMPSGYITEYENHSDLWVYINKRFEKWLISNVAPHITIKSKQDRITMPS